MIALSPHLLLCELMHSLGSAGKLLSYLVNILTQDVCLRMIGGSFLHLLMYERMDSFVFSE